MVRLTIIVNLRISNMENYQIDMCIQAVHLDKMFKEYCL